MSKVDDRSYSFGTFRLDATEHTLLCNGRPVSLTPKAFETLVALVERSGQLVTKEELIRAVWPNAFVEEGNLTHNIWTLRKALGETRSGLKYIETVPKLGYRFVARVEKNERSGHEANDGRIGSQIITEAGDLVDPLAVLPFTTAGDDQKVQLLADGFTEGIINSITRLHRLRVISHSVVARYKNRRVDPQSIGRELGVRAVLPGKIVQAGERVIVSAELVDVEDGTQLWGERYDRPVPDVFAIQEEVARKVLEALQLKLSPEEGKHLTKRYTENIAAYHAYLKGRYHLNNYHPAAINKAIECFELAICIDPCYALAYAGVADQYNFLGIFDTLTPQESYVKAKTAAIKALELDDSLAEAHTALAIATMNYEKNWALAETEFRRAIRLNPNYVTARQWFGLYLVAMGRFDEAMIEAERAREIDPLLPNSDMYVGMVYFYSRKYDIAIELNLNNLELHPHLPVTHYGLGMAYEQKGMYEEAIASFRKAVELSSSTMHLAGLGHAYAVAGRQAEARQVLGELRTITTLQYVSPFLIARVHVGLGEADQAFEWFGKACECRDQWLIWCCVEPWLDPLRADPRFSALLQRVNLAQCTTDSVAMMT